MNALDNNSITIIVKHNIILLLYHCRPDVTIIESMVRVFAFALEMDKAWYVLLRLLVIPLLTQYCRYYYDKFKEYNLKPT